MSIGNNVRVAIETECSAIKAGNVHPSASFQDMAHKHFVLAAIAIGDTVDQCVEQSVGSIVLNSVKAMMDAVGTNTSLGTILLFAPLIVSKHRMRTESLRALSFRSELEETLANLTLEDSKDIYEAVQIAKPAGLGNSASMDVRGAAPSSILDAMRLASDWDDIALQYVTQFELVFVAAERIETKCTNGLSTLDAVRCFQMEMLSERIDSLIARKQGRDFAKRVQTNARDVIAAGPFGSDTYEAAWHRFDQSLRDVEHRGNPGTIADLIAAALFVYDMPLSIRSE